MALPLSRRVLIQSAAATALLPLARGTALAATTTIDVCTDGDTNVSDWWTNTLKPAFEKAHPDLTLNIVITRANGSNQVVAQRVVAAKKTNADAKVDYFEEFDPRELPGAIDAGAFSKVDEALIPNYALLNPLGKETPVRDPLSRQPGADRL
jgi:putative spermidine/putrescine transport system substrate-binding protein